jgi:hypothetical protein
MPDPKYHPDFDEECRICGTSPCVVVEDHPQGDTQLCGVHFFSDRLMVDWEEWNSTPEDTE